jgi:hypothetical protein
MWSTYVVTIRLVLISHSNGVADVMAKVSFEIVSLMNGAVR